MALVGIYIDDNNQCQPVDENGKNLPPAFVAEMKLYKLCKIAIDDSENADKFAKKISDLLKKWSGDQTTNKKTKAAADKEAEDAYSKAKKAARTTKEDETRAENARHEREMKRIDGLSGADKINANNRENETYRKNSGTITRKESDAEKAAYKAKEDASHKADKNLIKPDKLDVKCSPSDDCATDCKTMSIYPDPGDNKKVKAGTAHLENVSHLAEEHFYFCTCGKK